MSNEPTNRAPAPAVTWFGLFISLFGMLLIRQVISYVWPDPTLLSSVLKEVGMWVCAIVLLIVIRRGEGLPFSSIGLGTSPIWKSILWGLVTTVACAVVGGCLVYLTGYGHGATAFDKLPLWLVTAIVVRAGVVEELFYRGYAIERLQAVGFGRAWAVAIPLIIFAIGHWTGGFANIVIALALGGILTAFYLWRRDLVANMIGHFLVDFVSNVLSKLF